MRLPSLPFGGPFQEPFYQADRSSSSEFMAERGYFLATTASIQTLWPLPGLPGLNPCIHVRVSGFGFFALKPLYACSNWITGKQKECNEEHCKI